jgi:hypothetical protein
MLTIVESNNSSGVVADVMKNASHGAIAPTIKEKRTSALRSENRIINQADITTGKSTQFCFAKNTIPDTNPNRNSWDNLASSDNCHAIARESTTNGAAIGSIAITLPPNKKNERIRRQNPRIA